MVYEQKVSLIIALNREIEKGRLKGDIYWCPFLPFRPLYLLSSPLFHPS